MAFLMHWNNIPGCNIARLFTRAHALYHDDRFQGSKGRRQCGIVLDIQHFLKIALGDHALVLAETIFLRLALLRARGDNHYAMVNVRFKPSMCVVKFPTYPETSEIWH